MLTAVKKAVSKLPSRWLLFVEWYICKLDSQATAGTVKFSIDCMLVLDSAPLVMLAVEFDGTSHAARPFAFTVQHKQCKQKKTEEQLSPVHMGLSINSAGGAPRGRKRARSKETWEAAQDQSDADRSRAECLQQYGIHLIKLHMAGKQVDTQYLVRRLTALADARTAAGSGDENTMSCN